MIAIEQLIHDLDGSRERLLMALEPLSDEALLQPGAVGEWSIAELLGILTAWESEMVTALRQAQQGKRPTRLMTILDNMDEYNRERLAESQGRDLDQIFEDWMKVRLEMEEWLELFPDRDLTDRQRYKWSNGRTLIAIITQTTIENERRYLPDVQRFAREWQQMEQSGMISLDDIQVNDLPDG